TRTVARNAQISVLANIMAVVNSSLDFRRTLPDFWREAHALLAFDQGWLALLPAADDEQGWVAAEQTRSPGGEREGEETDPARRQRGRAPGRTPRAFPAGGEHAPR